MTEDLQNRYLLDDQVGFALRRANQRHLAIFAEALPDMTPQQFAALAKLREAGPLSQNLLGRMTAMDAATIKGVIDRLRKRGLIESAPDPADSRRLLVRLSTAGEQAFDGSVSAARGITEATLAPLDADERAQFLALLARLT